MAQIIEGEIDFESDSSGLLITIYPRHGLPFSIKLPGRNVPWIIKRLVDIWDKAVSGFVSSVEENLAGIDLEKLTDPVDVIDDKADSDPKTEFDNDNPCLTDYERNR